MKFTFNLNKIVQVLAVTSAVAPQYLPMIPDPKLQAKIASGAVVASAIAGLLAHFKNPDGSAASVPYEDSPVVPKMPSDWQGLGGK